LKVCARVVHGVLFDQFPSTLNHQVLRLDLVLFPIIGFTLTESIVNLAVFEGVKVIVEED